MAISEDNLGAALAASSASDATLLAAAVALVLIGVTIGWFGSTRGGALRAQIWSGPVLWCALLALTAAGTYMALQAAQRLPEGSKDRAYAAQGIALGLIALVSVLVFSAGRRRSVATADIKWTEPGTLQSVRKGKRVTKTVRDANRSKVGERYIATEDFEFQEGEEKTQVKKDEELPAGAQDRAEARKKYRTEYYATESFSYRPKVTRVVKAGENLSGADANRPEAEGKSTHTRGLAFHALYVGKDGRWSTSKLQALLWTYAVLFGLLSLYLAAVTLDVELMQQLTDAAPRKKVLFEDLSLPDEYYLLLGGPFAAAVLAKAFTASKVVSGDVAKPQSTGTSGPVDGLAEIVNNDEGATDLIDTQYFLFNLLALAYFFASFIPNLGHGLPEVPEVLVGLTSAAALTYVTKKALERSTPSISSLSPLKVAPGAQLDIWGANLLTARREAPRVQIGGVEASPVVVLTDAPKGTDHLRVTVPARASGAVKVVVTPAGGKASEGADVTVERLTVSDATPKSLLLRRGASIVITGDGFAETPGGNTVTLGGRALEVRAAGAQKLVAELKDGEKYPSGEAVLLRVQSRGQADAIAIAVTGVTIEEVQPAPLPLKRDQRFSLVGHGFDRSARVTLGPVPVKVISASERQVVCELEDTRLADYPAGDGIMIEVRQRRGTANAAVDTEKP